MVIIKSTVPSSLADKHGVLSGDVLLSVNGNKINDVLDYRFYIMEKHLSLLLMRGGKQLEIQINKPEYSDIGLEFSTYLMDEKKRCRNNCIFCFIDQNPSGMRETVYFKDDDERLSFLLGNYVTLTNLKEEDIDRIIKMRISPVNVSVHTTDPALRVTMLRNRFAGESLKYIRRLDEAGIALNLQFVLCRGINDGESLASSLGDVIKLKNVESIALVPCGLTGHRDGLYPLLPFDKESASSVIDIADEYGEKCLIEKGVRLIYPSDEFFLLAGRAFPQEEYYEGYPQLENGVGMIRSDGNEFYECLENLPKKVYNRKITIATGEASFDFISRLAFSAMQKFEGLEIAVFAVKNNFFGGSVTVSGLVTGGDIISQLKNSELGTELLIPDVMLRAEGDLFLDNVSVSELEKALKTKVTVTPRGGYALCEAMLGLK